MIAVKAQRGMVLVTSLLLLLVVTMLAISMFRSMGLDEKIAGNMRDKQRALNAAETAEQFAESWLSQRQRQQRHQLHGHGQRQHRSSAGVFKHLAIHGAQQQRGGAAVDERRQPGGGPLCALRHEQHERHDQHQPGLLLRHTDFLHRLPRHFARRLGFRLSNRRRRLRRHRKYRRGGRKHVSGPSPASRIWEDCDENQNHSWRHRP